MDYGHCYAWVTKRAWWTLWLKRRMVLRCVHCGQARVDRTESY